MHEYTNPPLDMFGDCEGKMLLVGKISCQIYIGLFAIKGVVSLIL